MAPELALRFQRRQRLAQIGPRDAKLFGKLTFRWQPGTGRKVVTRQPGPQLNQCRAVPLFDFLRIVSHQHLETNCNWFDT